MCRCLERVSELYPVKTFVFCWIPGHMGIQGNERADRSAKSALQLPVSPVKIPYTDFKSEVQKYTRTTWQSQWDTSQQSKLYCIKPVLGESKTSLQGIP
mgnify:CR=1 FL=1